MFLGPRYPLTYVKKYSLKSKKHYHGVVNKENKQGTVREMVKNRGFNQGRSGEGEIKV